MAQGTGKQEGRKSAKEATIRQFTRVNFKIRVPEVRLIDAAGNMVGVVATDKARAMAQEQGLDLVEISPGAQPPVCRIMDFGKFRYEEQRKERAARKKQHSAVLKEIKFHVNVEEHDYQTKLNNIRNFLLKGHKVKITLVFRGRENAHRDLGFQLVSRVFKDCQDVGMVDMAPKLIGRGIFGGLTPRSAKVAPKPHAETQARPASPIPAGGQVAAALEKATVNREPSVSVPPPPPASVEPAVPSAGAPQDA